MSTRMKVSGSVAIALLAVVAVTGCLAPQTVGELTSVGSELPPYGLITNQQSANVITALKDDPGFVLMDIRTSAEVESEHLSGAIELDFYSDTFEDDLASLPRDRIYLIYCRTGNRTGQAFQVMEELGFEQVYDMGGGISQWMAAGYPICLGPLDAEYDCSGEFPVL
ncbi:rhodanese-like domain-containing protein [Candidatus Bipolaricaulota bacterium]|nr:rhodanese-like domain-containing protein [Candidatus Bipolaricaulota bacterium]